MPIDPCPCGQMQTIDHDCIFTRATPAEVARDDAMTEADLHAEPSWRLAARQAILRVALNHPTGFTTDEVWAELADGDTATHEPRALGAQMRAAAKAGEITGTDTYRPSTRADCHMRPVRVWRRGVPEPA